MYKFNNNHGEIKKKFMFLLKEAPKIQPKAVQQTSQQNDVDCDRKPKSLAGKKKCSGYFFFILQRYNSYPLRFMILYSMQLLFCTSKESTSTIYNTRAH